MAEMKNKKFLGVLAVILLIVGFFLLNSSITGNFILESLPALETGPLLGLFFVLCSAVIAFYIIRK
ncbi:hypothetical protein K0A97_02505 [Patescibacteria group bacterium]|nr:hypothetical protein [Patescibacteria group bacterium]